MADVDERSWSEELGMYARRYTIAKVTRRNHEDWAQDVYTLMRGDTPDARGWQVNDPLADEFERLDDPFYPFVELPADLERAGALKARVYEIPRSSAKKLLVALSTLWLNVEGWTGEEGRHHPLALS